MTRDLLTHCQLRCWIHWSCSDVKTITRDRWWRLQLRSTSVHYISTFSYFCCPLWAISVVDTSVYSKSVRGSVSVIKARANKRRSSCSVTRYRSLALRNIIEKQKVHQETRTYRPSKWCVRQNHPRCCSAIMACRFAN